MDILVQVFRLSAGIGLFLFAMYLIEDSLKNLSGRNFKLFLQHITQNRLGAVAGGAIVTGILQSSSMVSFMVLSFVGAGVFTLKNAMAVVLGANLGTTLGSWLVAALGFKMNIEVIAYPAVCIGGLFLILMGKRRKIRYISLLLLGFGLLFIGLGFMKTVMETESFDFSKYQGMPLAVFLFIGFVVTLIVQSSSVTMALTLSAIYAGTLSFPVGAAIVLGSETGTTLKVLLGALGDNVSKKRVALGNLFFNIFLTVFAFSLLHPILVLVTDTFKIADPLIGLVAFSSLINVLGILIFLPFLSSFEKFLEKFFMDTEASAAVFISQATVDSPDTALSLFRRETEYFIHNSMLYNFTQLGIKPLLLEGRSEFAGINERKKFFYLASEEKYEFLKLLQGELQAFYLELRTKTEGDQYAVLNQLISAVRSSMHSVKSIKDIGSNITNLSNSSQDIKFNFFVFHKTEMERLYRKLNLLITAGGKPAFEELREIYNEIQENYSAALNNFYRDVRHAPIQDRDITTVINFNRELFTSNKAMLMAVKDLLLEEKQAGDFNEIPVYKT